HRVAYQVIVQAVTAEHALLAEVTELRIADGPGRVAMIHRVPANAVRLGRFDDDVAAEVGHLATIAARAEMVVLERSVERDLRAIHRFDRALLGQGRTLDMGAAGSSDDDLVANAPALHGFR